MVHTLKTNLEPTQKLYKHILRTINVSKDDIDRNYVDNLYNYVNDIENGEKPKEAYEKNKIADVIEWINENEAEAKDRFGNRYNAVMHLLQRWINPPAPNSVEDLLLRFNDFNKEIRKEENKDMQMDNELKLRLAILIQLPNASELCHDTEERALTKIIKSKIEKFFPYNIIPSIGACKAALGEPVSDDELTPVERVQYRIEKFDTSTELNAKIKEIVTTIFTDARTNNGQDINTDYIAEEYIGKVVKDYVKSIYKEAKTQLNRNYHVGTFFPFAQTSLQAFYDEYKRIFQLGFKENTLKTIFTKIANYIHDKKEEEITNSISDVNTDEEELQEAVKVLRKYGYII